MKRVKMWIVECRDPSMKAFQLGLAAVILLAVAHLTANLLGGCICIWNKQQYMRASANKQLGMVFLIFSWYFYHPFSFFFVSFKFNFKYIFQDFENKNFQLLCI